MTSDFERLNKPREIEEWLDTHVWRRLGYLIVLAVRNTSVTPNMLSLASVLAAFACAWAYYGRDLRGALLGMLFMVVHSAFDAADGQLARIPGRASAHGRTIDGIADAISFTAIYAAILLSYADSVGAWLPLVTGLALAGIASHQVQCALVEHARQLFWYYCHGSDLPAREKPEVLEAQLASARGLDRVILRFQLRYSAQQRWMLPHADRLQREYESRVAGDPDAQARFCQRYRAANGRLVRQWAILAPNSHKVAIMSTAFLPVILDSGVWHDLGQATFYLFDLALNVPLVLLLRRQSLCDRQLLSTLPGATRAAR